MLNEDTILVRIGTNRSGQDSGEIDHEVDVLRVAKLTAGQFEELLFTLESARKSCVNSRKNKEKSDALASGSCL